MLLVLGDLQTTTLCQACLSGWTSPRVPARITGLMQNTNKVLYFPLSYLESCLGCQLIAFNCIEIMTKAVFGIFI